MLVSNVDLDTIYRYTNNYYVNMLTSINTINTMRYFER